MNELEIDLIDQVAWIRYRDLQLLTVANLTYIPDQRFSAVPSVAGDGWTLQIRWPNVNRAHFDTY